MNWYLSLTRGKQIIVAVLMAHGLLLAMLGADHWMHRNKVLRKKVTVNTFVLAEPLKIKAAKTTAAPAAAAPAPKAQTPAPPKKAVAKPEPKKPPVQTETRAPPPKSSPPSPPRQNTATEDSLISEIEKNLESLTASTSAVKKSNIAIPSFNFQAQTRTIEYSAAEQIAALLQETLELPEFGEVKIKLSINRFGALEKLEILESKNQKNAEFLKKRLPELQYPCLNEDTTLTIVFSNAF